MKKVVFTLFIFSLLVSGCGFFNRGGNTGNTNNPSNPQLEAEYRQTVPEILSPVFATYDITGVREKLLEVRTPTLYLDLHLELVLALDAIEKASTNGDQAEIEAGLEQLNGLAETYPWLRK